MADWLAQYISNANVASETELVCLSSGKLPPFYSWKTENHMSNTKDDVVKVQLGELKNPAWGTWKPGTRASGTKPNLVCVLTRAWSLSTICWRIY